MSQTKLLKRACTNARIFIRNWIVKQINKKENEK
jgi:hypothetical protein